jgi:Family of unknown function (DUF6263)
MNKYLLFAILLASVVSCKIRPDSSRLYAEHDENRVYQLRLNPPAGAKYYYDIRNESEIKFEVGDKKIDNLNRTSCGVSYMVSRDSTGSLVLQIQYEKLHVYTKDANGETEMDAANAGTTDDPVEKMLGALTSTPIIAAVTPMGQVRSVDGYKEMTDKLLTGFAGADETTKKILRGRLEQVIGKGIIKSNMAQLFYFFPDSAVHIGDKWKLGSDQATELNLHTLNTFTLLGIADGVATIRSLGKISNDSTVVNLMGTNVSARLKGAQEAEYEMDTHTGMLVSANITASVEGSIDVMGQEVPLSLETTVKVEYQK